MEKKLCCISCDKPLIAFRGYYLHDEKPCNGLLDYIYMEAQIEDEFLYEKFEKLYGKPMLNDYERIGLLENEIEDLKVQLEIKNNVLKKPLVKFFLKILRHDK